MSGRSSPSALEERNARFDALIAQLRKRGDLTLPPERQLCELLGCSRNTARKLLQQKADGGMVLKKRFGYTLSLESATDRKALGAFTFVTSGDSMIGNPAWAKLWLRLQPLAEAKGMAAELLLVGDHKDDLFLKSLERSVLKVVVVTTLDQLSLEAIRSLEGRTVITTEEHYRGIFPNVVALDNFKAGFLAAQTLAAHGYKRPAMISHDLVMTDGVPYVQYARRVEGFKEGCIRHGLSFAPKSLLTVEGGGTRIKLAIAKRAMELAKADFDSVFLHTDGELDFLMEGFASEGVQVPRDIGVITLNSADNAVRFHPPVTSVSHGTKTMAAKLVEKLEWIFATGGNAFGECLIEPSVHEGRSLK